MLTPPSQVRNVSLPQSDIDAICRFLQGAVYCWCKNRPEEWFSMRDLMGGENYYWQGTPLIALYDKQLSIASADPVKEAGKESGWLLKKVISDDARTFETKKEELISKYRWTPLPTDPKE
jgi:hypothetical protein